MVFTLSIRNFAECIRLGWNLQLTLEGTPNLFNVIQTSSSHVILAFSDQVEKPLKAGFKSFCFVVKYNKYCKIAGLEFLK